MMNGSWGNALRGFHHGYAPLRPLFEALLRPFLFVAVVLTLLNTAHRCISKGGFITRSPLIEQVSRPKAPQIAVLLPWESYLVVKPNEVVPLRPFNRLAQYPLLLD